MIENKTMTDIAYRKLIAIAHFQKNQVDNNKFN